MQGCPSPSILVASKHKQKCVFFIRVKQDARRYHQKKIPKNYEETEFICIRISEANLASIFTYVHPRVKKLDNSQIWLCQNWRKREDEREEIPMLSMKMNRVIFIMFFCLLLFLFCIFVLDFLLYLSWRLKGV